MPDKVLARDERILNGKFLEVNENEIKSPLDQVVKNTIGLSLNALLDQEADELSRAKNFEHLVERINGRCDALNYHRFVDDIVITISAYPRNRSWFERVPQKLQEQSKP